MSRSKEDFLRDWHLRQRVSQTATLVAPGSGIREKISRDLTSWAADFDRRIIFWGNKSTVTNGDIGETELIFKIAHEAGHIAYTGGYEFPASVFGSDQRRFHRLVNWVEDIRIERLMENRDLRGFGQSRNWYYTSTFDKIHRQDDPFPWHRNTDPTLSAIDGVGWFAMAIEHGIERDAFFTAEEAEYALRFWPRINAAASAESTAAMIPILTEIWEEITQQQPQQPDGDHPQEGDGDSEAGDGEETGEEGTGEGTGGNNNAEQLDDRDGSGNGDAPVEESDPAGDEDGGSESSDSAGDGDGQGESAPESPNAPSPYPLRSEHDPENDNRPGSITNQYDDDGEAPASLAHERHIEKLYPDGDDPTTDGSDQEDAYCQYDGAWRDAVDRHRGEINTLARLLQTRLRHNAQDAAERGQRRGRFDSRQAYRAMHSNRIFTKKGAVGGLDYTVGLLMDRSGSMYRMGSVEWSGIAGPVVIIAEALERAGINSFICTWDDGQPTVKRSTQTLRSRRGSLMNTLHPRGNTYEAPALAFAASEFAQHRSGKHILVSVTDGITGRPDESEKLIAELQRDGVLCIGVGLGEAVDGPPEHWPVKLHAKSMDELVRSLTQVIAKHVHRGA